MREKMKKEILATIDQFQDIHGWQQQESRNALVCEIRDRVEAVLAEQKRREAKKEPQMNATMADEVRQQPADDVVERMYEAFVEAGGHRGAYRAAMTAVLAVAREGWVSASQLEAARASYKTLDAVIDEEGIARSCINPAEDLRIAIRSLKQQLSTMYSLEQVEQAILQIAANRTGCPDWSQFVAAVRARLTAKQQPTEQEIVTTVLEKWTDWQDADQTNQLSASEVADKILAALGKGGK